MCSENTSSAAGNISISRSKMVLPFFSSESLTVLPDTFRQPFTTVISGYTYIQAHTQHNFSIVICDTSPTSDAQADSSRLPTSTAIVVGAVQSGWIFITDVVRTESCVSPMSFGQQSVC
jgi:hypothetical protein